MRKWQVLDSDYVIKNNPYNSSRKDKCRLPNGMEIDVYVNEYPNWVNAIVLTPDNNVVLVRQYRHGVGDFVLETPGGMVDEGEPSDRAIVREVLEETGYQSRQNPIFLGEFHPNPATSNNLVATYLFLEAYKKEEQNLDATEEMDIHLVPFSDLNQRIRTGKVPQMFTAFGYYLAKDYLKL